MLLIWSLESAPGCAPSPSDLPWTHHNTATAEAPALPSPLFPLVCRKHVRREEPPARRTRMRTAAARQRWVGAAELHGALFLLLRVNPYQPNLPGFFIGDVSFACAGG